MDKKTERIIDIHNRLRDGRVIVKSEEAARHNVNDRTIQRDLDDLRAYYTDKAELGKEVIYDRTKKGYVLAEKSRTSLTNSKVLSVCKILLESRSMVKEEMFPIIDKLLHNCVPYEDGKKVAALIANEKLN